MRPIKKGSTDQSVVIRIIDATTGLPETGVEHDSGGIDLWWRREQETKTSIVEAALAALDSAHSDGGIEHISDGYYRLDLPDAAVAAGAGENGVMVGGAVTGMIVIGCYIPLVDYDPYDSVRAGLTALPNAAADAAGGLPISDAGGLDLDTKMANTNEVTAARMGALTDWINGGRLDLLLDAIPTTAMRGTDNAALASVCTEARLAELAAANMPTDLSTIDTVADAIQAVTDNLPNSGALTDLATAAALATVDGLVDTLIARLTAARAGYLDELGAANIPADVDTLLGRVTAAVALASVCTEARLSELDVGTAGKLAEQLDKLMIALANKAIITEATGNTEQFDDAGDSLGSIAAAFATDGTYTTRKRLVI